jgi:hypothetical protein
MADTRAPAGVVAVHHYSRMATGMEDRLLADGEPSGATAVEDLSLLTGARSTTLCESFRWLSRHVT